MKIQFRTYNDLKSTVFDLISGKSEVKQTLALGYLLANDLIFLTKFFKIKSIRKIFKIGNINKYSDIIIHTELISENKKRIDIAILFYVNGNPDKALIIEAKSIKTKVSPIGIKNQIENYLFNEKFTSLNGFKIIKGCSLTKNQLVINSKDIALLSWNELINILIKSDELAKDYLNFLTKINGTMKFYEKEVYSIPAGDSYKYQYNYPFIYECPNEGKNFVSIKKPLYFAFRKEKGIMEKLFGVNEIIVFNPKKDFEVFLSNPNYSNEIKKRIKDYCDDLWGEGKYDDNEKQFFILSTTNQLELEHKPRPEKNNAFRAYYALSELLNKNKMYVETEK